MLDALATFQRSLITPDARFDRFLRGERDAITPQEERGYQLFKDYGCVACHQGVNVGGNLFQRFGIFRDPFAQGPIRTADLGRFTITDQPDDRFVFRVPSLRNVAVTAPYFHDGRAADPGAGDRGDGEKPARQGADRAGNRTDRRLPAHTDRRIPGPRLVRSGRVLAMTGAAGRMVLVVLGLLLVLTYLLLRGAAPDAALHERRLRAIDELILNQAALQRDVLRASHGLLLNYDPLVATVKTLREVAEELRGAAAARSAASSLIESIAAGLDEQEALVEDFKSAHALLRNSLTYFGHLSRELGTSTSQAGEDLALVVGRLANSVFRFVGGSADDAETAEVAALLDKLSILAAPAALRDDVTALRAHGDLILRTLPAVDGILARLLATRISADAGALRDLFVEEHRHAERLAWIFRVLLYLASVALLIYLSHLYVRLRANARTLKARSDFEHLVAGISAQLIDTPLDRTGDGVRQGLEQLGRHTGVDRAYVVVQSR